MWVGKKQPEESTLDMTPLVDVVFLLIIFFMLSTTFIVLPGLKINLPAAASEKIEVEPEKLVLSVDEEGTLYFDDELVDRDSMKRKLREAAASDRDVLILLKGDRQCVYGRIVDLLDMVHQTGLNRVAIVTSPEKEPKSLPAESTE
jgi:biopolymer transport protein ExbD